MEARRKLWIRPLAVVFLVLAPATLSASCGSDDDEIVNSPPKPHPENDASSFGGSNGFGGSSGSAGTGGVSGNGGASGGGSGGSSGGGTCSPDFCPMNGVAQPCCVVEGVGPCGFDYGMGCQGGEPRNDI